MKSNELLKLAKLFKKNKSPLFLVGGFVRDEILKTKNFDIDITSSAQPDEVKDFLKGKFCVVDASKKLGTMIISGKSFKAEYTPFRSESYLNCTDHTPEKVIFETSLLKDANRRDFTVNCLYKNILTGEIIDPFGGLKDIKSKTIKQIHSGVFEVDPLRILRMVRFSAMLDFKIDSKTFESAKKNNANILFLSKERISDEIDKIIKGNNAVFGVKTLIELGVFPNKELTLFKQEQTLLNLCCDLFYSKPQKMEDFLNVFSKNNKEKEEIKNTIDFAKEFDKKKTIEVFIGNELFIKQAQLIVKNKLEFNKCLEKIMLNNLPLSIRGLKIDGNDLLKCNIEPIKIGTTLNRLLKKVVLEKITNTKKELLKAVKEEK